MSRFYKVYMIWHIGYIGRTGYIDVLSRVNMLCRFIGCMELFLIVGHIIIVYIRYVRYKEYYKDYAESVDCWVCEGLYRLC